MMVLKIGAVLLIVLIAFVAWRYTSVARGAKQRDAALLQRLDPLSERFESKAAVAAAEVETLASVPELRPMLYTMLDHYARSELFPRRYLSEEAQAESQLVYWMLHPNELDAAPAAIQLEEKIQREVLGRAGTFYVFRFRMPPGHWAGQEWELGLAGPYFSGDKPYRPEAAGGFSRGGDAAGKVAPKELVDWYVEMWKRKTAG